MEYYYLLETQPCVWVEYLARLSYLVIVFSDARIKRSMLCLIGREGCSSRLSGFFPIAFSFGIFFFPLVFSCIWSNNYLITRGIGIALPNMVGPSWP